MTFTEWVRDTHDRISEDGFAGVRESAYQLYLGTWRRAGRFYNYGLPVYERNWDLLVVLDACRADLLAEVVNEYDFLNDESVFAAASTSAEWMEKCFLPEPYHNEVHRTSYVSGNPFTDEVFFEHRCPDCGAERSRKPGEACAECGVGADPERVPTHEFASLEEVWQTGWDDNLGTIPASTITNHTIEACRNGSGDRVIAHYMQPHHPFVGSDIETSLHPSGFGEMGRESVWDQLRAGHVDRDQVWRDYRENLRYVLDEVERLLRNVDAERVVITADHGNAVGELGLYGHYRDVPLPSMKRVPWCVTEAENTEGYQPDIEQSDRSIDADVEQRLKELGYA